MERPWVTPEQVKEYTDSDKVKSRSDLQLGFDIKRAENYVIYHTHNRFTSEEYEEAIPEDITMAVILLAEAYALKSINMVTSGNMKSEQFDDYSYTIDTETDIVEALQLGPLLDPYIISDSGRVVMKLRKL